MREPNFMRPMRSPRSTVSPFVNAADDSTGQDADDLPEDDRPAVALDPDFIQLVVVGRLLVGRQELAGPVVDPGDRVLPPGIG